MLMILTEKYVVISAPTKRIKYIYLAITGYVYVHWRYTDHHPSDENSNQIKVGRFKVAVARGGGFVHHPEVRTQVQVPW